MISFFEKVKEEMEKELENLEKNIYEVETKYIEESINSG